MKKRFIRQISFIMICAITVTVSGCGSKKTTSEVWEEYETVVSGEQGSVIKGTEDVTEIVTDNGEVVKVEARDTISADGGANLGGATVTIANYSIPEEPQAGSSNYKEASAMVKAIEKKYNCKIKWLNISDALVYNQSWVTAAAAGTKFADIVWLNTEWIMPQQMVKGYVTPIDSYFNFNDPVLNGKAMNKVSYKGKHYIVYTAQRTTPGSGLFFNKALFSRFGVKSPADYVKENNWNWDTFLKCAQDMTRSSGGTQYYGLALANGGIWRWPFTNVGYVANQDESKFNMDSPAYIEGLQFAWDLYNTHHVTPSNCADAVNVWKSGVCAMIPGSPYEVDDYGQALGNSNVGFTFLPLGKRLKSYSQMYSTFPNAGWVIPSTVKNPEIMAKIIYDWAYPYTWKTGWIERYEKAFGDAESLETAKKMADYSAMNVDQPKPLCLTNILWGNYGIEQKISPQAYIASVKAEAQAELDSLWAGYEP